MSGKAQTVGEELGSGWLKGKFESHFNVRIPASATNRSYSVTEFILEKGDSTPVHIHTKEEEYLLVLEGTARVLFGDETIDVPAGTSVTLPRGIQHAWGNASDEPLRATMTAVPGGCEEALTLLAEKGDTLDLPALLAIAEKYGVESVGPPLLSKK